MSVFSIRLDQGLQKCNFIIGFQNRILKACQEFFSCLLNDQSSIILSLLYFPLFQDKIVINSSCIPFPKDIKSTTANNSGENIKTDSKRSWSPFLPPSLSRARAHTHSGRQLETNFKNLYRKWNKTDHKARVKTDCLVL